MNAQRPSIPDPLTTSFTTSYAGVVAFITVATEGSFARAADRLGIGRSAVSRSVQRLEDHLGARLLSRTTRSTSLTSEGELFLENCRPGVEHILRALEEIRDLRDGPPKGLLRISSTPGFGRKVLAPLMGEFRLAHPAISIELLLEERSVDLAVERVDVAFRDGKLEDSQVIAKKLIPMQMVVCASPDYAARHGLPRTVDELTRHMCINRRLAGGRLRTWDFKVQGQPQSLVPEGSVVLNDDDLIMSAIANGHGLAQLPAYQVCSALRAGTLVACLQASAPDDRGHYVCYLSRRQLPKRIRAFIDYVTTRVRALDLDCAVEVATGHRFGNPLERGGARD